MLEDLIVEARACGLEVHPDKTKVLWNGFGRGSACEQVTVPGQAFEVLKPEAATMYLGRLFCFRETHDVELCSRVNKTWAKFAIYRDVLTDKG